MLRLTWDRQSSSFFFLIHLFIYLFIYFWLHWVFVAACGLSLVVASGGYSSLRCTGFLLRWLLLLQSTGSRRTGFSSCSSRALGCRLRSCGAKAYLLCGMWGLPRPGLEPVSPALAGRFLTAAPPGKSQYRQSFCMCLSDKGIELCLLVGVFSLFFLSCTLLYHEFMP